MNHRLRSRLDHAAVAKMLPDFVLGKLDEGSHRRVSSHVEACPRCRDDCANALDLLGTLNATPPPPSARAAILRRAAATAQMPAATMKAAPRALPAPPATILAGPWEPPVPAAPVVPERRPTTPFGRPLPRFVLAAASLAVLVVGTAGSAPAALRSQIETQMLIYQLTTDPAAAHPLNETDTTALVSGVLYAKPNGDDAYLVANGLPALPANKQYQVWLFTDDGERIDAGPLSVSAEGDAHALIQAPAPFNDYFAVALSPVPRAVDSAKAPGGMELTLGGVLQR